MGLRSGHTSVAHLDDIALVRVVAALENGCTKVSFETDLIQTAVLWRWRQILSVRGTLYSALEEHMASLDNTP